MDPCVTCGTTEETTSVCTCDCQCLETARRSGCREIKLIAPTRDTATAWTENDPIVPEGVFFLVKDRLFEGSLEYAIGDGESKYSELSMLYAGAPLSRTGAENHSPLAASGKSTLDPSWLPAATSSTLGAVMVSTTGAAGKVPIPASGSSTLDPSWLPVSTSGAANKIPIADNNGKLDPSWLPEATSTTLGGVKASTTTAANCVVKADANGSLDGWKDAIIDAITADDGSGGLVTDPNTGELMVDFSQMPTDKFEALLKGLKMQIPLESNLSLYVNKNHASAADTIEDGRGTQNKPFKTIQACVNYVTQNYALGPYIVTIYIAQATYTENVVLPTFTRTSGSIVLRAVDYANPPTISAYGDWSYTIDVRGGPWHLKGLNIARTYVIPDTDVPTYNSLINCGTKNSELHVYGCSASAGISGTAPGVFTRNNLYSVTNQGALHFEILDGYPNTFHLEKGNLTSAYVLQISRSGQVIIYDTNTSSAALSMACSGSCTAFCDAFSKGTFECVFGATYHPKFTGSMTGSKYNASSAGTIYAPADGFPCDSAGTAVAADFSYYHEYS